MSKIRYRSGDTICLKPGVLGRGQPERPGHVLSALPETHGLVRYRVRFDNENFDRSISQDEIDMAASTSKAAQEMPVGQAGGSSSWVNLNSIRLRK